MRRLFLAQRTVATTTALFVLFTAMTRLEWWVYIGSDVWDPRLTGWEAGSDHQIVWLAALGAATSSTRFLTSRSRIARATDLLVVVIATLLAFTAAFGGRNEVMYGSYDRTLFGGKGASAVAAAAALLATRTLLSERRARRAHSIKPPHE